MNVMTSPVANPLLKDKGLEIVLSDGQPHYFNYYWLRDNCPSSFSSATRERGFDIFHLDAAPVAASAEVAGDALELTWTGEDHVTRFPLAWLETYAAPGPRHDPADLPRGMPVDLDAAIDHAIEVFRQDIASYEAPY